MVLECPNCHEILEVPDDSTGCRFKCSCCSTRFAFENGRTRILPRAKAIVIDENQRLEKSVPITPDVGFSQCDDRAVNRSFAWRRWTARTIDMMLWRVCFILLFFIAIKLGLRFESVEVADEICTVAMWLGYFFFDAGVFALCGTTLGKRIMHLSVCDYKGELIGAGAYFKRNFKVLLEGYWIVLPFFGFWAQYGRVKAGGKASYDQGTNYDVVSTVERVPRFDWTGIFVFVALVVLFKVLESFLFG